MCSTGFSKVLHFLSLNYTIVYSYREQHTQARRQQHAFESTRNKIQTVIYDFYHSGENYMRVRHLIAINKTYTLYNLQVQIIIKQRYKFYFLDAIARTANRIWA